MKRLTSRNQLEKPNDPKSIYYYINYYYYYFYS